MPIALILVLFLMVYCPVANSNTTISSNIVSNNTTSEATENYKVIGRGIYNARTDEVLQIACVGHNKQNSNEPDCSELQFYLKSETQGSLIGPVLKMTAGQKVKSQLSDHFVKHGITDDLSKNRKFAMTRKIFAQSNSRQYGAEDAVLLTFTGWITAELVLSGLSSATAFGPVALVVVGAGLTAPIVLDVITYPFAAILDKVEGNAVYGFNVKNINALNDKAKYSWQFKPKKVKADRFESIVSKLGLSQKTICELDINKVKYLRKNAKPNNNPTIYWKPERVEKPERYSIISYTTKHNYEKNTDEIYFTLFKGNRFGSITYSDVSLEDIRKQYNCFNSTAEAQK